MLIFITRRYHRYYHVATSGHRATIPVPARAPDRRPPPRPRFPLRPRWQTRHTGAEPGFSLRRGPGCSPSCRRALVHGPSSRGGGEDRTDDEPVEAHPERRPVLLDGRRRAGKCIDAGGDQLGLDLVQDEFATPDPTGQSTYAVRKARRVSGYGMSGREEHPEATHRALARRGERPRRPVTDERVSARPLRPGPGRGSWEGSVPGFRWCIKDVMLHTGWASRTCKDVCRTWESGMDRPVQGMSRSPFQHVPRVLYSRAAFLV